MKKVQCFLVLMILFSSCSLNRLFFENDYSYETDFTKYKTYNFLDCEIDTSFICSEVHEAIRRQLKARGYKAASTQPELLVGYSVIKDNVRYRGFLQPMLSSWLNVFDEDNTYRPNDYRFTTGMILVSLIDGKSNELVWRGYAGGVFDTRRLQNSRSYYHGIVRSIFDQYPLFAAGEKPRKIILEE